MRATNLMYRCPKEQTPDPYFYMVILRRFYEYIRHWMMEGLWNIQEKKAANHLDPHNDSSRTK